MTPNCSSPVKHATRILFRSRWLLLVIIPCFIRNASAVEGNPISLRTPAAAVQLHEPPAWLRGWSIVKLRIPNEGDIQEAYADLQSPAGRAVTLTAGEMSIEGVSLERLQWSGSPVEAKVVLRHGNERAALFSPTTRIAKVNELERKSAPIGIDAQLIELPDAIAKTLTIPGHGLLSPAPLQTSIVSAPLSRVLTKEHVRELLDGLALHSDVHVLRVPRVMVKSPRSELIELVHSSALPLFSPTPAELENHSTYQSGVLLEVEAAVRGDGMIDLLLIPQIAEFKITPASETPAGQSERKQIFSTRAGGISMVTFSDQSVLLSGLEQTGKDGEAVPSLSGKTLLLLITARNLALDQAPR